MSESELRGLLTQLHARLASARELEAEDRRLLLTVLADIESVLAKRQNVPASDTSGIESLAVKFEAGHPALAESLRRFADALGKAGV
jgi:hypothetical protein